MPQLANASPERLADHFVNYLFDTYKGSKHVRRVASWVGLIVKGIQKLNGSPYIPRDRQLRFDYRGRTFKAKFDHHTGGSRRGGIEIVEILPGRGSPEGRVARSIRNLDEAALSGGTPAPSASPNSEPNKPATPSATSSNRPKASSPPPTPSSEPSAPSPASTRTAAGTNRAKKW